jgi:hypothetical protein
MMKWLKQTMNQVQKWSGEMGADWIQFENSVATRNRSEKFGFAWHW